MLVQIDWKHRLCPDCRHPVNVRSWSEPSEYWGSIVYEPIEEIYCPNCDEVWYEEELVDCGDLWEEGENAAADEGQEG